MNRKALIVLTVITLFSRPSFSETIYLRNGTLLKARITGEDASSILVETETEWKRISKNDIETIKKNNEPEKMEKSDTTTLQSSTETEQDWDNEITKNWGFSKKEDKKPPQRDSEQESTIKVGFDVAGNHSAKGTVNGIPISGSESTGLGISLSGDHVYYASENVGLGFGASVQLPRNLSAGSGSFWFLPVYGLLKIRTAPNADMAYQYLAGQIGYGLLTGDDSYKGVNGKVDGGLYYAIGTGVSFGGFQIEALYSVDRGSFEQNVYGYDYYYGYYALHLKGDIEYSKINLNISYNF